MKRMSSILNIFLNTVLIVVSYSMTIGHVKHHADGSNEISGDEKYAEGKLERFTL